MQINNLCKVTKKKNLKYLVMVQKKAVILPQNVT